MVYVGAFEKHVGKRSIELHAGGRLNYRQAGYGVAGDFVSDRYAVLVQARFRVQREAGWGFHGVGERVAVSHPLDLAAQTRVGGIHLVEPQWLAALLFL